MAVLSPSLPFLDLTQKHTAQLAALRTAYVWTFSRCAPAPSTTPLAVVPVRETPFLPAGARRRRDRPRALRLPRAGKQADAGDPQAESR